MSGNQLSLRTYALPSKGQLLLSCRKCQKKIKSASPKAEIANLKKALKRRARQGTSRLRILQVPCLKLCPKDGVVVCTQCQLSQGMCSILRTAADLDILYAQYQT